MPGPVSPRPVSKFSLVVVDCFWRRIGSSLLKRLGRSAALPAGVVWLQVIMRVVPSWLLQLQNCREVLALGKTLHQWELGGGGGVRG